MFKFGPKIPGLLLFIFMFITTFLLSFLLLSCYNEAEAYSGIYLTSYYFTKSKMLSISFNGTDASAEDLTTFSIKIGYLSFCVDYHDLLTCSTFDNIGKLKDYPIITVQSGDSNTTLDLVKLAKNFNNICFSYVLMMALVLSLISLGFRFWNMIPLLPGKKWIMIISTGVSFINAILWGLGAMLQHEAVKANHALVPSASMSLIQAKIGQRAESVSWTAFAFLTTTFSGNVILLYRDLKVKKEPRPEKAFY